MQKFMSFFVCLVVIITRTKEIAAVNQECTDSGEIAPQLAFLVTVEGKSFWAEPGHKNWTAAAAFCEFVNMKLASITTERQFAALQGSYSNINFKGGHWTSGRDALTLRQFSWNYTEDAVSTDFAYRRGNSAPFQTCLAFYSASGTQSFLYSVPCTTTLFTLCEA